MTVMTLFVRSLLYGIGVNADFISLGCGLIQLLNLKFHANILASSSTREPNVTKETTVNSPTTR